MTRLIVALGLLIAGSTLFAPAASAAPTASTAPPGEAIDQASWNARKRHVELPNGIRLAYVELGDPRGTPVLLLHGFTDSSRVWTILAPSLRHHRLLILDQRGHGGSDAPACCYAPSDLAEDARLFLDAMAVERAAVVGHSMGSMVAQLLAAEHPGRVTRIALIGSTALVPVRRNDWLWTNVMGLGEPIAGNREFLAQWSLGASPTPVDPILVRHADAEAAEVSPIVWRSVLRELVDLPIGRHAADVRAPVLILSGGRDELFPPEHHRSLLAAYPGAEAHVFPELGHNFIVEQPVVVGPVLAAFLRGE